MPLVYTTTEGRDPNIVELLAVNQGVERPLVQGLTSSIVENLSVVPGATVTAALDDLAAGVAPPTGYVSRHVYVNPASTRVGTTYAGVVVEAAPAAWTDPSHIPPGNIFEVVTVGCGGSGASSTAGHGVSDTSSDAPGGGGAFQKVEYTRADLIAALPIPFTVPLGPVGGAPTSTNALNTIVSGNVGIAGSQCDFGSLQFSGGGGGGGATTQIGVGGHTSVGGAGGGCLGNGTSGGIVASATLGGAPVLAAGVTNTGYGGAGASSTQAAAGTASVWGGSSGGTGRASGAADGAEGGTALYGAAGGGVGGTTRLTGVEARAGGRGGRSGGTLGGAGGLGATGTGAQNGAPGQPGLDGNATHGGSGGGGGGGARTTTATSSATGGDGGEGGFPGGGGGSGGSGAVQDGGAPSTGFGISGRGGPGGDAMIMVTGKL